MVIHHQRLVLLLGGLCLASLSFQLSLHFLVAPPSKILLHPPQQQKSEYCGDNSKNVFIDVGANNGDTLDVLRRLRPDAYHYKCYAWECNPANLKRLHVWLQTYGKDWT